MFSREEPAEVESIPAVPSSQAALCCNCDNIVRIGPPRCPMCGSDSLINLAEILNPNDRRAA